MFDVSSRVTYTNVPKWVDDLRKVCPDVPAVLLGNKVDVPERQVKATQITYPKKVKLGYYDMSVKSNYNFEKAFLYLARKLTNTPDLEFTGNYAKEPEIVMPADRTAQLEAARRLAEAEKVAIPDAD